MFFYFNFALDRRIGFFVQPCGRLRFYLSCFVELRFIIKVAFSKRFYVFSVLRNASYVTKPVLGARGSASARGWGTIHSFAAWASFAFPVAQRRFIAVFACGGRFYVYSVLRTASYVTKPVLGARSSAPARGLR